MVAAEVHSPPAGPAPGRSQQTAPYSPFSVTGDTRPSRSFTILSITTIFGVPIVRLTGGGVPSQKPPSVSFGRVRIGVECYL